MTNFTTAFSISVYIDFIFKSERTIKYTVAIFLSKQESHKKRLGLTIEISLFFMIACTKSDCYLNHPRILLISEIFSYEMLIRIFSIFSIICPFLEWNRRHIPGSSTTSFSFIACPGNLLNRPRVSPLQQAEVDTKGSVK